MPASCQSFIAAIGSLHKGSPALGSHSADRWPEMLQRFMERQSQGADLLAEFMRHVAAMTRGYPNAYFALGRRNDEAVDDLGHRAFASCTNVVKGRFPFQGRTPFSACLEEAFDGRTIRYHSIYAKLSITREILRDDYAHNLRRDPVLRWRAELYSNIGKVLKAHCEPVSQGRALPPRWRLSEAGLSVVLQPEVVEMHLRDMAGSSLDELVVTALRKGGPMTRSQLARLLGDVLQPPTEHHADEKTQASLVDQMGVRRSVGLAWATLEDQDRQLLASLARGASYDELIAEHDHFKHRTAVSRAVSRCSQVLVNQVLADLGLSEEQASAPPRQLVESLLEVLVELLPELMPSGGAR